MFGRVASRSLVALLAALLVIPVVPATPVSAAETPTVGLTSSANPATYGDVVTFTATVSGGSSTPTGTVKFMDGTTELASEVLDVSGEAAHTTSMLAGGSHSITVEYSGDGTYDPSTSAALSQTVDLASQTITFGTLADRRFDEAPPLLVATASSGLPVTFTSQTSATCAVVGGAITFVAVGDCTVRASQAGNDDFAAATPVDRTFTIAKGNQAISFGALAAKAYGDAPFTVSATATSGLAVSFASQTTGVCTTSGTNGATVTLIGAGTCTIRASQTGNTTWNAATPVDQGFAVGEQAQTITFGTLGPKTYGDAPFGVTATASSGLAVSFSSLTIPVCTVAGSTVSIVGAGTCTIRASQAGNASYFAAPDVDRGFTVAKAAAVVTADDVNRPYGAADPVFTATITGLVGSDDPGQPACSTTPETPKVVGDYPITCSHGSLSTASYSYTYVPGTLSVTKATLTVKAADTSRQYGLDNPATFAFTYVGFVAGDDEADVDTPPTCTTTTATPASPVGEYAIVCSGGIDADYAIASPVDGTFTIEPARPEPEVSADVNPAAVTEPVEFTARVSWRTGTPTGTVTFFVDGGAVSGAIDLDADGSGSYSTSSLSLGDHVVTVVYTPNAVATNFATTTSPPFTQSIGTTPVDVQLTSNRTRWETNVPITFTAALQPRASRVTAPVTGQVVFAVDGVDKVTVNIVGGLARYASPPLASGAHAVTARYLRDTQAEARFTIGNPGALAQTVIANTVTVAGVGVSSSSVYPVRDTWRDTVAIRGTRNEAASVSIKIYRVVKGPDPLVRSRSYSRASGTYSYAWNGRKSSGRILPAGKYKVVQLLTDAFGAKKKVVSYVTLSTKKMTWYTKTITVSPGPRKFSMAGDNVIAKRFSSTSATALVIDPSGSAYEGGWTGVGYQFTLPSASSYSSVSFQVKGSWTGTTAPKIGLIPWNGGNWSSLFWDGTEPQSRVRVAMGASPTSYYRHTVTNLTGIRSGRYVRAAIDSFEPPTGYGATGFKYTITSVRLAVTYGILK